MGDILSDDEQVVELVFFLQFAKIGEHFPHEVLGLAMNAETVFVLVIFLGHHGVILRCQNTGCQDGDPFIFVEQGHGRQCGF